MPNTGLQLWWEVTRSQLTVTSFKGEPGTISLTWLCRPSGIRADGVGASGSQGWLPAL